LILVKIFLTLPSRIISSLSHDKLLHEFQRVTKNCYQHWNYVTRHRTYDRM